MNRPVIGTVKLYLHRDIAGTIKTLTIKREGERFYAVFTCQIEKPEALPVSYEDVGIDLGITHFAARYPQVCLDEGGKQLVRSLPMRATEVFVSFNI